MPANNHAGIRTGRSMTAPGAALVLGVGPQQDWARHWRGVLRRKASTSSSLGESGKSCTGRQCHFR